MKRFWVIGLVLILVFSLMLGNVPVSFSQKKYNEAPMLAELVKQGKLPPVEQRLPEVPYVVKTMDGAKNARYGGMLRFVRTDPYYDSDGGISNLAQLVHIPGEGGTFKQSGSKMVPDIVQSYEVSEDSKVFTFHLREGLKWSDGYPVTTEDVQFAYEDVLLNDKLTPVFPKDLTAGDNPCKVEIVDKYTFKVRFSRSYGGFLGVLGRRMMGYSWFLLPKHYLKEFHPKYTSIEKLEPLIKEAGFEKGQWWNLFNRKTDPFRGDIGCPVLTPWVMVESNPKTGVIRWERNPYYYKCDEAGNQLPYIDYRESSLLKDPKMVPMKVVAGEVDFMRQFGELKDLPLYKEYEEKAGIRVLLFQKDVETGYVCLNQSHKDPVWRKIVGDVRFRRALSMAINRKEIINTVYLGLAVPSTLVPSTYDPVKASQLLDQMGLNKRDSEGWRLGPDGKRFEIPFEVPQLMGFEAPMTEMVIDFWKKVGIYATMKTVSFELWDQLGASNEIRASIHWGQAPATWKKSPQSSYDEFLPDRYRSWGAGYRQWYDSGGKTGVEPPSVVKKLFELKEKVHTGSPEEAKKAAQEIAGLHYNNVFIIALTWPKHPIIFSGKLGGLPPEGGDSYAPYSMMIQFYFKQ
ncbi:TPA: ABC transporter substrate-binding protein [bacterium]|nr:ABC transporter substrate-binding protein [bacterium]